MLDENRFYLRAGKLVQAKRHNYVDSTDYVVTETYGYQGPEGRVSSRRTTVRDISGTSAGSQWFEQSFTYDELGNLDSQDYPACRHARCSTTRPDRTVSYSYNRGFLTAVPGYAPSLTYHRNGALKRVEHENGALDEVTIASHQMPRPERMTSTPVSGPAWDSGPFVYDAAGNIQSIGSDQYYYDEVSRLVQAEVHLDGQQAAEHYTYDRFGNLTSMATQGLGSSTFDTVTWNVDPLTNRLIPAAAEFAYDAAGNLTTSGAGTGTFDAFNMMTSLSGPGRNERYLYTPQDERIATIRHLASPPSFEWTLRGLDQKVLTTYESELLAFEPDPGNPVQEIQGWSWQKDYVYRGSSLLAAEVTDNVGGENREHFHLDHLGTPRLKTDQHGTQLVSHKYLPYGEELTNPDLDNEVMQFTAHERDRDPAGHGNDLDYMHARYYSPRLGRFLSVDPVGGRPELPQSWNRYGYVLGNPVGLVDPDGNEEEEPGGLTEWLAGHFRSLLDNIFPPPDPPDEDDPNLQALREIGADPNIHPRNQVRQVQEGLNEGTSLLAAGVVVSGAGSGAFKLVSRISESASLVRAARALSGNQQKAVDKLTSNLAKGVFQQGSGTKSIFKGVFEARTDNGARVLFRKKGDTVEILAKFNKSSQARVFRVVEDLFVE